MDAIERFFSRTFGDFFGRLSSQMGYKMTDMAETKVRDTLEKSVNRDKQFVNEKTAGTQD